MIFISKTNGIDVWDLVDQSHKASMSFGTLTTRITYLTFQECKQPDGNQYLAYGEDNAGTIFLLSVPPNLRESVGDEKATMSEFWSREIKKCYYQAERKKIRAEEKEQADEQRAIAELLKEHEAQNYDEEAIHQKELDEEEDYQLTKLRCQKEFGIITQEQYDKILEEKKKTKG